jgi:hypothetical protein
MSSVDDDTKREELLSYRDEVVRELERRAGRIKEIDAQIATTQYAIDSAEMGRVPAGQTLRILTQVSYRERLKKELKGHRRVREEALADLRRAEARLVDVDNELSELEEALEGGVAEAAEKGEI